MISFADDSNIFAEGSSMILAEELLNKEFPNLIRWLSTNRLSLNIKKTNNMIFGVKKWTPIEDINIKINGETLIRVEQTKFLGVILDSGCNWQAHIIFIEQEFH
jgi:hypothetical protein